MNNYPFNRERPVRRLIIAGRYGHPSRQINAGERPVEPTEVPVLTVPMPPDAPRKLKVLPVQSDRERGEGDSVNSRLHRLMKGSK